MYFASDCYTAYFARYNAWEDKRTKKDQKDKEPMPRRKNGPKRPYTSVKIELAVYRKLRTVAAWHGSTISDYVTEIVNLAMDRELAKMAREIAPETRRKHEED